MARLSATAAFGAAMFFAGALLPAELPSLGEKVSKFTFTDIRYLPRRLADLGDKKAYVVVFTTLDCPLVKRYLPRLKALDEAYRGKEVQFLALNVGADDPLVEVAYQALKADLAFPVGKDFDGVVAKALGAARTPEVVLLDAERKIRYRGRIDDRLRLGGARPSAEREDLKEALDDVLAGREVRVAETPVDGCLIEFDALTALPAAPPKDVNYSEHVAPILARHCQECHRPESSGPFSLLSYRDALAHADTIAEVVRQERMPPAFASREHGEFTNRLGLSALERAAVLAWAKGGKPEGDPGKLPKPREFSSAKWKIGEPDLVIKMPGPVEIPAEGYVPYKYVLLPYVFINDTWIQRVEILPGNKAAVHHCNMGFVTVGGVNDTRNFITGYVPGGDAMILDSGLGFKIPGGSMLVLQVHYVTTGAATTDQTSVGIGYAKEPIDKQLRHFQISNRRFEIPPGAPHHAVSASRTFSADATGIGMFTHMHVRGKDMVFRAAYPEGKEETLLAVPNYNFDWQLSYRWSAGKMKFSKGTRIDCTAHFDNSPFNPYNPDPKATVRDGQQTYQEMMYGFLFYTHDDEKLGLKIDPKTGRVME
jgi:thiol-disulfide isomerase/thioredoxin/mono/diheme cytochrome c family protein